MASGENEASMGRGPTVTAGGWLSYQNMNDLYQFMRYDY